MFLKNFLKKYRIKISLTLLVSFIILLPFIPLLRTNPVISTLIVLAVVFILAALHHHTVDMLIIGIVSLGALNGRFNLAGIDEVTALLRISARMAFLFLSFTLIIGPWSRWSDFFLRFYKHRRHIGVTTFLLALNHASLVFSFLFARNLKLAFSATFVFFGFTGLFILTLLALTSWDYIQKHITNKIWGVIHPATLLIYSGFMYYFYTIHGSLLESWHEALMVFFLIFWFMIAPWALPRLTQYVIFGWKQLHILIHIAYISIVVHIAIGSLINYPPLTQYIFWVVVLTVVTSHAVGWVIMIKQALEKHVEETTVIDGLTYYKLDSLDSFVNGVGRKFIVNKVPLAVFWFNNKLLVYSNICAHQGGPLYKGEIVNGYLECPWHKWQYSTKDGCGPPGFRDCVPLYKTLIQNNNAYVAFKKVQSQL